MDIEQVRDCALALPGTYECFPFGKFPHAADVWVAKVEGKMFLMCDLADLPLRVDLKAGEQALFRMQQYRAVERGFANGWCGVLLEGDVPGQVLRGWIEDSYRRVLRGLPRRLREKYDLTAED